MNTMYLVTLMIFLIMCFIVVRNEIVCRVRIQAIDIVYANKDWDELKKKYLYPRGENTYYYQVFDLTKWTFNQFFPGLKEAQ